MKKIFKSLNFYLLIFSIGAITVSAGTIEEEYPSIRNECALGNYQQCAELASMSYVDGYKHKRDLRKTFNYAKIACEHNNGKGCFFLGLSYLDKHPGILAVDMFKAHEYYKKSCDLGYGGGCFAYADDFKEGKGVRQNYKTAVKYFKKAIKLGNKESYVNLGILYYNGRGTKRNVSKAKKFFAIACDNKIQMGCDLYREVNR